MPKRDGLMQIRHKKEEIYRDTDRYPNKLKVGRAAYRRLLRDHGMEHNQLEDHLQMDIEITD